LVPSGFSIYDDERCFSECGRQKAERSQKYY